MDSWAISFYKLFHMSTSHVSCYSCTTKNSSDHLMSQSPHRTNTKPRDKQWPQNSHYSFLRNNMLTLNTQCADRPMREWSLCSYHFLLQKKKQKKTASCWSDQPKGNSCLWAAEALLQRGLILALPVNQTLTVLGNAWKTESRGVCRDVLFNS